MDRADTQMSQGDLKPQHRLAKSAALDVYKGRHGKSLVPQCQPDLFDSSTECTANDTSDYRQSISHFFGRNKLHKATIPHDCFPLLCRKHCQDRHYRLKDNPGTYAALQCDLMLNVLKNMAQKAFIDEYGNEWPWWCGFELRLSDVPSMSMPPWLPKMCLKAIEDYDETPKAPSGLRCNLLQLVQIFKALRMWCTDTNSKLPPIEALPVTIGLIDKQALKTAEKDCKKAQTESNVLRDDWHRLTELCRTHGTLPGPSQQARRAFEASLQEVESAKQNSVFASMDLKASATTLPATRKTNTKSDPVPKCSSSEKTPPDGARRSKRKRSIEPDDGDAKRIRGDQVQA